MNESTQSSPRANRLTHLVSERLSRLLDQWRPSAEFVFLGTSLIVGLATGLGAVLFRYLITGIAFIGYEWLPNAIPGAGKAYVIFVPALGGLAVGLLVFFLAREVKGHGVPEVMEAVALRGGRIRPRVAAIKALASSLTIGSGGSAGREGPIVQIGSAIGSTVGQVLNLADDRISNLVACGAAAGIAATFNAPIAGVMFALEVILSRFTVRHFSTVVISAVAASVVGRAAFGDFPAFAIPFEFGVNSLWEYLLYPLLGVLAALVGVLFTRSLYATEDIFERWRRFPEWVKPALGGASIGVLAMAYPLVRLTQPVTWERIPHVFNVGYDVIESALSNEMLLSAALLLMAAKIIATCLSLGSGGSGGVFAPSLFIGAMLGAAFDLAIDQFLPGIVAPPGAYAIVGMAAVFAAAGHAPITAVIILFELTGDYQIILPLMLTVVISTLVSQRLLRGESIYTLKLSRRGVHLHRGRDQDILQSVQVGEVMTDRFNSTSASTTIEQASDSFDFTHTRSLFVLDEQDQLAGILTLSDLERAFGEGRPPDTPVLSIATVWPHLQVTYPNESVGAALAKMGSRGIGQLPVVSRSNPRQLVGLISRVGITMAYTLALSQRSEIGQRSAELEKRYHDEVGFVEFTLEPTDWSVGKLVRESAKLFPGDSIMVSIQRGDRTLIPHGDTEFEAGDRLTAFMRTDEQQAMRAVLRTGTSPSPS